MKTLKIAIPFLLAALLAISCGKSDVKELEELGFTIESNEQGSGATVAEQDYVKFHFTITTEDGTMIGSSVESNQPQTTKLGNNELPFDGWEMAFKGMKTGGKRTVIVPSELAFGEQGIDGVIPPNENLRLTLELLEIIEEPTAWRYRNSDLQTTESGLRYVIQKEGRGDVLASGTRTRLHYSIFLDDGTFSYSTRVQGAAEPYQIGVDDFIEGMNEAVADMREGEQRTVVIPSQMAFGERGAQGIIPPNADIVMDLEIISIDTEPTPWSYDDANVKSTDTGLKYVVQQEGSGERPRTGDNITVHYSGYLEDGSMFDSSVLRDQPFNFTVGMGQVIRGWDEGLLQMREGERRTLIIPFNLAYGEQGRPPTIPPRATLIFDVELVEIN